MLDVLWAFGGEAGGGDPSGFRGGDLERGLLMLLELVLVYVGIYRFYL